MIKNQSFYQSILQNSILVIKVSGKICDNQENIENVISDIKELLNSISKFFDLINILPFLKVFKIPKSFLYSNLSAWISKSLSEVKAIPSSA